MVSFIAFLLKKAFVTHIKTYFLPAVYGYFLVYNSLIHLELAFVWCKLRKCFPTQPIIQNKCFFKKKILQDQSRLSLYFTNYHINSNVMGRREKKNLEENVIHQESLNFRLTEQIYTTSLRDYSSSERVIISRDN